MLSLCSTVSMNDSATISEDLAQDCVPRRKQLCCGPYTSVRGGGEIRATLEDRIRKVQRG